MSESTITGGCLCGRVRYEVKESDCVGVAACHCHKCQQHTGAPFAATVRFKNEDIRWTGNPPDVYQSSAIMQRGFCKNCGSSLYIYYPKPVWEGFPVAVGLLIGSFDDPHHWPPPATHYAEENQLAWTKFDDGIPRERMDTDEELKAAYAKAAS